MTRQGVRVAAASAEGENLARLAADMVVGHSDMADLISSIPSTFNLDGVSLLSRQASGWQVDASVGQIAVSRPDEAQLSVEIATDRVLALAGEHVGDGDDRLLSTFVDELRYAREQAMLVALGTGIDEDR